MFKGLEDSLASGESEHHALVALATLDVVLQLANLVLQLLDVVFQCLGALGLGQQLVVHRLDVFLLLAAPTSRLSTYSDKGSCASFNVVTW